MQRVQLFFLLGLLSLSVGCAGPSTPFGALPSVTPVAQVIVAKAKKKPLKLKLVPQRFLASVGNAKISLTPDRQVLHDHMDLTVAINDHNGINDQSKLVVTFNGSQVKTISDIFIPPDDKRKGYFTFKNVRLRDDRENQIMASYMRTKKDSPVNMELLPPDCSLDQRQNVANIGDFDPQPSLLRSIENYSYRQNLNPSLMTGVIAQESAFDSEAISWAKAIGLTQITPIGDEQIKKQFPQWPRSPLINKYPASVLKAMIASNQLQLTDDWRLDPNRSIQGGLALMNYMKSYWQRTETQLVLDQNFGDYPSDLTSLTLASYHSGPVRVRRAIVDKGKDYLKSVDLKEANRYVRRVKSYCYHFANGTPQ